MHEFVLRLTNDGQDTSILDFISHYTDPSHTLNKILFRTFPEVARPVDALGSSSSVVPHKSSDKATEQKPSKKTKSGGITPDNKKKKNAPEKEKKEKKEKKKRKSKGADKASRKRSLEPSEDDEQQNPAKKQKTQHVSDAVTPSTPPDISDERKVCKSIGKNNLKQYYDMLYPCGRICYCGKFFQKSPSKSTKKKPFRTCDGKECFLHDWDGFTCPCGKAWETPEAYSTHFGTCLVFRKTYLYTTVDILNTYKLGPCGYTTRLALNITFPDEQYKHVDALYTELRKQRSAKSLVKFDKHNESQAIVPAAKDYAPLKKFDKTIGTKAPISTLSERQDDLANLYCYYFCPACGACVEGTQLFFEHLRNSMETLCPQINGKGTTFPNSSSNNLKDHRANLMAHIQITYKRVHAQMMKWATIMGFNDKTPARTAPPTTDTKTQTKASKKITIRPSNTGENDTDPQGEAVSEEAIVNSDAKSNKDAPNTPDSSESPDDEVADMPHDNASEASHHKATEQNAVIRPVPAAKASTVQVDTNNTDARNADSDAVYSPEPRKLARPPMPRGVTVVADPEPAPKHLALPTVAPTQTSGVNQEEKEDEDDEDEGEAEAEEEEEGEEEEEAEQKQESSQSQEEKAGEVEEEQKQESPQSQEEKVGEVDVFGF